MKDTHRISVIIPNYNRGSLIGATIENMLCQSLPPYEIIVVDDGSSDNSREIIRHFGKRVILIEQENQGPGTARNRGFAASSGDLIQFMDSDDLVSRNKLEVQVKILQKTGADFAYCPWVRSVINGGKIHLSGPVLQGSALPEWKPMLEWQLGSWCLVFQNCLFRRESLEKAGSYRNDMMVGEDGEYLVRILLNGAKPVFTEDCLVFYRVDGVQHLTSDALNDGRRTADLTKYYHRVAEQVANNIGGFHRSSRQELALDIYRHNRYCAENGWEMTDSDSSAGRLVDQMLPGSLVAHDLLKRFRRKISRLPSLVPDSDGMAIRPICPQDQRMAEELGFEIDEYVQKDGLE